MICGKWTLLTFREIHKFSILPCAFNPEVKKVEFHVLMKIKSPSSNKQFLVESHAIKQKIKLQTLSFHVIIVGLRLKHSLQLIYWIMISLHHKQLKLGKEMSLLTQFINIMLIMAPLLKSTESTSQSLKMDFSMFQEESQLIWTN